MAPEVDEAFVVEGKLVLESQEGGYAFDAFLLDGKALEDLVAGHFGVARLKAADMQPDWWNSPDGASPGDRRVGRVRITIERLEGVQR